MAVTQIGRPIAYKGRTITIRKVGGDKYVYLVTHTFDSELTGVAGTLEEAFSNARKMIDRLEAGNE